MANARLTKSSIDRLSATNRDTIYWDEGLPGFGLRCLIAHCNASLFFGDAVVIFTGGSVVFAVGIGRRMMGLRG